MLFLKDQDTLEELGKKIKNKINKRTGGRNGAKRKFLSISVHIICSVREENELWEEEERNPSEDLTRLSDGARGLPMNNT